MVCNEIIFGGNSILKIYHKDFSGVSSRKISHDKKIGGYKLIFREYEVTDNEFDRNLEYAYKCEGLLEPKVFPNPYGDRVCSTMTHYIFDRKPSKIYGTKMDEYSLKIPIDDFIEIAEFIEKYTGMNIKNDPMILGDIFVCSICNIDIKANKDNGITLRNIPEHTTIAVCFKNNDLIVYSEFFEMPPDKSTIDVNCKHQWNNHDIYIYKNNKLIYSRKNLSYIRAFNIQTRFSINKTIPLNTIGHEYVIKEYSSQSFSGAKKEIKTSKELIDDASRKIIRLIDNEKNDTQIFFIKPAEIDKARGIIGETLVSAEGELWIFDAYFTDKDGLAKSLDWLKIISSCKANKKNIVFYSNDPNKCLEACNFITRVSSSPFLQDYIRNNGKLDISFYQTTAPIHDRFVLVRNETLFYGLNIGTSFNSLERNHYCINKLNSNTAKTILTELTDWLNLGNIKYHLEA